MIPSNAFTAQYRNAALSLTASIEDRAVIENHRWRLYHGTAVTCLGTELVTLDSLLLGIASTAQVTKRNHNPHDFTRPNLTHGRAKSSTPSRIDINGPTAYLVLRNAETVILDADDVPHVDGYNWGATLVRNRIVVMATTPERRKLRLTHAILGLNPKNNVKVQFRNGDPYDCRKSNLVVGGLVIAEETL